MKTKRSTLIGLLSTLLVIVTVLSSVLVFTATADTAEPKSASDDRYVYATSKDALFEEVVNWYPSSWAQGATWKATASSGDGILLFDLDEIGDYDVVEIGIGDSSKSFLNFAFLSKAPVEGEELALVGDVKSYDGGDAKKAGLLYYADIPEGANYLAIRARAGGMSNTCPRSLAFERTDSNLLDSSLDSYAYPMSKVVPSMAVIASSGNKYNVVANGEFSTALIPIEGTTFDAVTFRSNAVCDTTVYAFLTEAPVPSKSVSLAGGMTATATAADGETVKIPEDAKYLAVLYKEYNYDTKKTDFYLPFSITFVNWAAIPSTATTNTVAYTGLVADGCIYGWGGKTDSHKWVETDSNGGKTGLIDLRDRNYTKVSFTVGSSGYLGYGILRQPPVLGETVSYTGGATTFTEPKVSAGQTVEVDIPSDATTIVVWMKDAGASTNFAPSAISLTYEEEVKAPYGLELKVSAEARLNANSGLRFTTRIPTAELVAGLDYTVGTLVYPTDKLEGALTVETDGVLDIKMTKGVAGNEYTYFSAAMTSIISQNYARAFTAVSYIKVDDEYYYTAATTSSVYEAAVETYKANTKHANADAVRAYIDGVVVIENGVQVMPYDGYEHALTATITDGTLTITGEATLATVIIDGVIYTGGWTATADGYTATTH